MNTYWGDLTIGDAHVHFFSHKFFAALASQHSDLMHLDPDAAAAEAARILGWHAPPRDPAALAAVWTAELDRHGVSRAALIASVPGDEPSVAAALAAFPERFHGYCMLNPLAPDALDRAESALASGIQGLCFFPAMHRYSIGDPRVEPILQAASTRSGIAVFVHCGVLTVGVRRKLGLASPYDMRYSNPIDIHPVALLHPKLNFVVPHFGAGYFREALMLCDLCPNVYLDTSSTNSWVRYQSPEMDLKAAFERALDVAGPKRLLFGTDSSFFPRGWQEPIFAIQSRILYELGVTAEHARLILGENLRQLLCRA